MSRQYNPAVSAYNRMNLDDLAALETPPKTSQAGGGLLVRNSMGEQPSSNIDYKNPAVRVAKQMQVIRKRRNEINAK